MNHQPFSTQGNSAAFEKEALERFRHLTGILPRRCQVYREVWGESTVLTLDFLACPTHLIPVKEQSMMLLLGADHLGLAQSILFRLGPKIEGWVNFRTVES
ncbi:hypothetical protein NIES970_26490 [[Synechococcus] sp. NIES-970]|uniref:hypothetical protein n=1 Tax=Picosynechococcus sp. NKBG15041c TaxID=1407650 RepID=UPI0004058B4E|nr:hypothetical protein [Picosynechococcus sp. NKBG15041c]BAW97694.1 hypothetical protein NIES970_26490 [[Synechococcus] sp. NIES-970]